jgi:hypothetical protein
LPSEEISSRLPELVAEATKEVYQSFQFFEPSLRLIEEVVDQEMGRPRVR